MSAHRATRGRVGLSVERILRDVPTADIGSRRTRRAGARAFGLTLDEVAALFA